MASVAGPRACARWSRNRPERGTGATPVQVSVKHSEEFGYSSKSHGKALQDFRQGRAMAPYISVAQGRLRPQS